MHRHRAPREVASGNGSETAYAGREEGKRTIPEELPCLMAIWRSQAGFSLPDAPAVLLPYRLRKREGTELLFLSYEYDCPSCLDQMFRVVTFISAFCN